MDRALDFAADSALPAIRAAFVLGRRTAGELPETAIATAPSLYTRSEEIANWLTHACGALLSAAALAFLVLVARTRGDAWHLLSFSVFGVSLLVLYTISTLYHAARTKRQREWYQRLDHAAIFVLIAGTYTPFLLTKLRGHWGWLLLAVVWLVCGAGALYKLARGEGNEIASTLGYLLVAWLIVVAIKPLLSALPPAAVWCLFAGGAFYTSGVVFFLWHRLRYHHAIWHAFVLGGSACHFCAVIFLAPPA